MWCGGALHTFELMPNSPSGRRGRRRGRTIADRAEEARAARAAKAARGAATEAATSSGATTTSRTSVRSNEQGTHSDGADKGVAAPEAEARAQMDTRDAERATTSSVNARHSIGRERGHDPHERESYHNKRQRVQRGTHSINSSESGDGTGTEDGVT